MLNFLGDLITAHDENIQASSTSIPFLPFEWARREYYKASKRILFMDDEGTLMTPQVTNHFSDIQKEKKNVFALLTQLCKDEKNHVYFMSSRTRAELEEYLVIPRLGLRLAVFNVVPNPAVLYDFPIVRIGKQCTRTLTHPGVKKYWKSLNITQSKLSLK
ncbi:hypothetical protein HDV01_001031 [Terramyces sp. JEL0728]|nr:hypothetical protein HDV01_001031 [Terramyces sp. JEL0728]